MHFGASAGGQMQGAATQAMPVSIVEERQRSRWPPAAGGGIGGRPQDNGPVSVQQLFADSGIIICGEPCVTYHRRNLEDDGCS